MSTGRFNGVGCIYYCTQEYGLNRRYLAGNVHDRFVAGGGGAKSVNFFNPTNNSLAIGRAIISAHGTGGRMII